MKRVILVAGALLALAGGGAAQALTISDPVGDFQPIFSGPNDPDLDVVSFTVEYDAIAMQFELSATLAGPIDTSRPGLYAIGVNTGTGPIAPFGDTGNPNVRFNQVIAVQKTGMAAVGGNPLMASVSGANLSVLAPLTLLPSTGFAPERYGFNIWPRLALGPDNSLISDFAPNNATLAAVPEPATWAMMILGFGAIGGALRRRRTGTPVAVSA